MDKVYTVPEVAQLLKLKGSTVRKYIYDKELPAFKVGREYRILESDLKKFIKNRME